MIQWCLCGLNVWVPFICITNVSLGIGTLIQTTEPIDILIFDSETGHNVELDVALAHPWASDILLRAATTGGSAALRREQSKENKYREETLPGGYSPTVVPLVFEHFGRWGGKPWITSRSCPPCRGTSMGDPTSQSSRLTGGGTSPYNCNIAMQMLLP